MGQKDGEKWTAAVDLQPTIPTSGRLLCRQVATWITLAGMAAALSGCAGPSASELSRYHCDGGMEFTVRFADGSAILKGARGDDVLLRDAGGQGAQTVYSNPQMRAEFGLGAGGREAVLHYPVAPLATRCVRE